MAELEVVTNADHPDLGEQLTTVFRPVWPEFIFHDPIDARYASRAEAYFPQYNLLVLDGPDIVTGGWGVRSGGTALPATYRADMTMRSRALWMATKSPFRPTRCASWQPRSGPGAEGAD
jgi:hypothetical protein